MSYEGLGPLVEEIREASRSIEMGDARTGRRIDGLETSINELYRKVLRPGPSIVCDDEVSERKSAIELCHNRRALTVPKIDTGVAHNYTPTSSEIEDALLARKAIKALFRHAT